MQKNESLAKLINQNAFLHQAKCLQIPCIRGPRQAQHVQIHSLTSFIDLGLAVVQNSADDVKAKTDSIPFDY